ncbi:class I SAM-dependent methyltransferase [Oceanobacillus sp. 1P07AA]|uniref:class I SAM-dependent methyltransferase n=1 Tax=Oceanobacillus sp. 1P07AA TaxID=3132293 RepID=UPI0039A5B9D2
MTSFQSTDQLNHFINTYNLYRDDTIQQVQLNHRLDLVKAFKVEKGMRIIEIGCGQGDTTAALADAVGESGRIVAIDIAKGDYGAPLTLDQANKVIKLSPLGDRISFYLDTDFLEFETKETFDMAILSHSSWYFNSNIQLQNHLKKLRQITKKLCVAEWDLAYSNKKQRPHFLAASILALYSNFVSNDGNIQHLFDKRQIQTYIEDAGFNIYDQCTVDASYLQDGQWEISYANSLSESFSDASPMIQTLVQSYYGLMNQPSEFQSLNSFVLCAN